jgi:hypothetical protein
MPTDERPGITTLEEPVVTCAYVDAAARAHP